MRSILLFLLAIFFSTILSAQTSKPVLLKGQVVDALGDLPLPQAAIRVISLPDSSLVKGTVTIDKGNFQLEVSPKKDLMLVISYLGFKTYYKDLHLSSKLSKIDLGKIVMNEDAHMLGEAVVEGHAPEMVLKEDTVEYNADSYKLPASSMVEDLIKKLPGVEIDEDGNITAGGKTISRILVDGKEFFGKDVAVALKNINVDILNKLQVIDRKSEEARLTGVDDGEDEKVINLTIKEGMKKGWFGNSSLAFGSRNRYEASSMTNRFVGDNQFSLLAGINNTNNIGFADQGSQISSGGSGMAHGGLTTAGQLGTNVSYYKGKELTIYGNILGSGTNRELQQKTSRENILSNGSTFYDQDYNTFNQQRNINSNFRIEWDIDSLTKLNITPSIKLNTGNSSSFSDFQTKREDGTNINDGETTKTNEQNSINYNVQAMLIRKSKHKKGRRASLSLGFYGDNRDGESISESFTEYGDSLYDPSKVSEETINQLQEDRNRKLGYRVRATYVEPFGDRRFFQFAYMLNHSVINSERSTYNWDPIAEEYMSEIDTTFSDYFKNTFINQNVSVNLRTVRQKYNYTIGLNMDPSMTKSVNRYDEDRSFDRHVINWGPSANLIYLWSKHHNIRLHYKGRTQQPSITQLQPSKNITNPLYIREGNLDLAPSYTSMLSAMYNRYSPKTQRSFSMSLTGRYVNNSIVNKTTYFEETGVRVTKPINVNGVWNAGFSNNIHLPFKNKHFKFNNNIRTHFNQQIGFTNEQKNIARTFSLIDRFNFRYSGDVVEAGISGNYSLSNTSNTIADKNDQKVMDFGGTFNFLLRLPIDLSFGTDLTYLGKEGYAASIEPHVFLWNLQANYEFLKQKKASLYVRVYDLLKQQNATRRRVTSSYIEDVEYNSLTNYFLIGFVYRLNTMGKG